MTMSTHRLAERTIPRDSGWDVIVAGGGPAGCAAATAAAREGARTLLLEATSALGGMGTSGLVPWFCGYSDGKRVIARGLAEHVRRTCIEQTPHLRRLPESHGLRRSPSIDPELLKRIYDDMVTEAGATVRFNTQVCAVEMADASTVDAVIAAGKAGLSAFSAGVYVDCTGDADVATWAGADVQKGDEKGNLQPATHCFIIGNVDEYALRTGPQVHFYDPESPIHKAVRSEKYPFIIELHSCNREIGPGTYGFNTGHVFDVDNTDPVTVSEALIHGRRMAAQYRDALAEFLPAYANSFLVATGSLLGIRETRRILGNYVLTIDDYHARRSFPDEICRNAYGIDVHSSKENALAASRMTLDQIKERNRKQVRSYKPGESMGVPYRCLTSPALSNVLVAGRAISTDRQTNGSVRIMACCINTGEAAGIAAARAAADGQVHNVDTDALRARLLEKGAYLP